VESFRKQIVSKPAKPDLPYSPAVSGGPFVFVSGSVGRDPARGQIAKGDVAGQTRQAAASNRA
jgi:enamine deaminase RidA (YjgF/YER057c/UK114 family)